MAKRFLFVQRRAPHGTLYAQEALDVLLTASAFDQNVALAFIDDGVYQLVAKQDPDGIGRRNFTAAFRALADHGVTALYVEGESLLERALDANELLLPVSLISRAEMAALMEQQDVVLNF